jgi:hypothetical protein
MSAVADVLPTHRGHPAVHVLGVRGPSGRGLLVLNNSLYMMFLHLKPVAVCRNLLVDRTVLADTGQGTPVDRQNVNFPSNYKLVRDGPRPDAFLVHQYEGDK